MKHLPVVILIFISLVLVTPAQAKKKRKKTKNKPHPRQRPSLVLLTSPTNRPSNSPTISPSMQPSRRVPTMIPKDLPSSSPSYFPSSSPTSHLTSLPSSSPSFSPSSSPYFLPSYSPSEMPTNSPSYAPTIAPTIMPTTHPTTMAPTKSHSSAQSINPTIVMSSTPSSSPSLPPVTSASPSIMASTHTTTPTMSRTTSQTSTMATNPPSIYSTTISQSGIPTLQTTLSPSLSISGDPTDALASTVAPSAHTLVPSENPSAFPTTEKQEELIGMRLPDMFVNMELQSTQAETFDVSLFEKQLTSFLDSAFHAEFNTGGNVFSHVSVNATRTSSPLSRNRRTAADLERMLSDEETALTSNITVFVLCQAFFFRSSAPAVDEFDALLHDWSDDGTFFSMFKSSLQTSSSTEISSIVSYSIAFTNALESLKERKSSSREFDPNAITSADSTGSIFFSETAIITMGSLTVLFVISSIALVIHERRQKNKKEIFDEMSEKESEVAWSEKASSRMSNLPQRDFSVENWCLDDALGVNMSQKGPPRPVYDASGLASIVRISNEVVKKSKTETR